MLERLLFKVIKDGIDEYLEIKYINMAGLG